MKFRISSSEKTLLQKNITRFAPVWMLYSVFLLLSYLLMMGGSDNFPRTATESASYMVGINLVYALICGQLLFGDLFNTRMCNGIHALPVRRDTLYWVNFVSGMLFSLVPNTVITVLSLPFMDGNQAGALVWLGVSILSFFVFFSMAVFCALTTGSRFAMALLYGLINAASPIVYWLVETIYIPLLPTLIPSFEGFDWFCPVYQMIEDTTHLLHWDWIEVKSRVMVIELRYFGYMLVLSALSLGLTWVNPVLYRKRHLETAGDLMCFRIMKPIFLTAYALVVGACIYFIFYLFFNSAATFFLYVGVAIGVFTGLMLLQRRSQVFNRRSLALCAAFLAILWCTMFVTALDPLGLTRWVPKVTELEYIRFDGQEIRDPELMELLVQAHEQYIEDLDEDYNRSDRAYGIVLGYKSDGFGYRQRELLVREGTDAWNLMARFTQAPEYVLYSLIVEKRSLDSVSFYGWETDINGHKGGHKQEGSAYFDGLIQALIADCEAGHIGNLYRSFAPADKQNPYCHLELEFDGHIKSLYVYPEAENTITWLREHWKDFTGTEYPYTEFNK